MSLSRRSSVFSSLSQKTSRTSEIRLLGPAGQAEPFLEDGLLSLLSVSTDYILQPGRSQSQVQRRQADGHTHMGGAHPQAASEVFDLSDDIWDHGHGPL